MPLLRSLTLLWLFAAPLAHLCAQVAGRPVYMYPLSLNGAGKPLDWGALRSEATDRQSQSASPWVVYWVSPNTNGIRFMDAFYVADLDVSSNRVTLVAYSPEAIVFRGGSGRPVFSPRAQVVGTFPLANMLATHTSLYKVLPIKPDAQCGNTFSQTEKMVYYSGPSVQTAILAESLAEAAPLFVYDERDGMYLVASSGRLSSDPRTGHLQVKGWISQQDAVVSSSTLALEPHHARALKVYCTPEEAEKGQGRVIYTSPKPVGKGVFNDSVLDPNVFRPILISKKGNIATVGVVQHKELSLCHSSATIGEFYNQLQKKFSKINIVIMYEKSTNNAEYINEINQSIEEIESIRTSLNANIDVGLVGYGNKGAREVKRFGLTSDFSPLHDFLIQESSAAQSVAIKSEGADMKTGMEAALAMFQSSKANAINFLIVVGGLGDFELSDRTPLNTLVDQMYRASVYSSYFCQTYISDKRSGEHPSFTRISKNFAHRLMALNASFLPDECKKGILTPCDDLVGEQHNDRGTSYADFSYVTAYNKAECRVLLDGGAISSNMLGTWMSSAVEGMTQNIANLLNLLHTNPCWFEQTTPCQVAGPGNDCTLASLSDIYRQGYVKLDCSTIGNRVDFSILVTEPQLSLLSSKMSQMELSSSLPAAEKRKLVSDVIQSICYILYTKIAQKDYCFYSIKDILMKSLSIVNESEMSQCISIGESLFHKNICKFADARETSDSEINEVILYFTRSGQSLAKIRSRPDLYSFTRDGITYWWVPLEALFPN